MYYFSVRIPLFVSAAGILAIIAIGFTLALRVLARSPGRRYVEHWALAWAALGVYALASGLTLLSVNITALASGRTAFALVSISAAWLHLRQLELGMYALCAPTERPPRWRAWLVTMASAAAALLVVTPAPEGPDGRLLTYLARIFLLAGAWGLTYLSAGLLVRSRYRATAGIGRSTLMISLGAYALLRVVEPLSHLTGPAPILAQFLTFGGLPLLVGLGVGMVIVLLEVERDRVIAALEAQAKAEIAAKGSEARLSTALASSLDAVLIINPQGELLSFNPRFAALVREARGVEVRAGMAVTDLIPQGAFPEWPSMFAAALAGDADRRAVRLRIAPGVDRVFSVRATPVLESTRIVGVLVVAHDATEEERLRTEMARREDWFRSMIENANDIIVQLTHEGKMEYVSPSVVRILGRLPSEITLTNGFALIHPDDQAMLRDALERSFAGDPSMPTTVPFRARHANGEFVHLEAVSRPYTEANGQTRLMVAIRDVRERRRLENELLSARRLESLGRLAGGVAHDFNNLLTAIMGNLTLMRERAEGFPDLQEHVEEAESAAQRGAELTRRLLAFARRQRVEPRVLDVAMEIQELERLLKRLLGEPVSLVLDFPAALWQIRADPAALEQMLVNLAVNARDAMPDGGTMSVRVSNEHVADAGMEGLSVPAGDWLRIDVHDTGTGIPAEIIGQIFEPFFTTKEPLGGSGLGLATVYGAITQAGGHVRVKSPKGEGTTFSLFFPRERAAPRQVSRSPHGDRPMANPGETLLLIEDEASVRDVTAKLLGKLGYTVITAVDGLDGVEKAATHDGRLDIVISDLMMPVLGGVEAVARILERRPNLRVLFISGYSESSLHWTDGAPRVGKLLQKPFSVDDLARAVRTGIDG